MSQAAVQREILDTLTGLKQEVSHLKMDMHHLLEYLEDTKLTEEEKKMVDRSIANLKTGNKTSFVSHKNLKKELGL